jgi:tetratricopeptide (TPR) repeat protein
MGIARWLSRYSVLAFCINSIFAQAGSAESTDPTPNTVIAVLDSGTPQDVDLGGFVVVAKLDVTGDGVTDQHGHASMMVKAMLKGAKFASEQLAKQKGKLESPPIGVVFIKVIDRFGQTTPERVLAGMQLAAKVRNCKFVMMAVNVWVPRTEAEPYFDALDEITRGSSAEWIASWPNDFSRDKLTRSRPFPSDAESVIVVDIERNSDGAVAGKNQASDTESQEEKTLQEIRSVSMSYYHRRGLDALKRGDLDQAEKLLLEALSYDNSNVETAWDLAAVYFRLHEPEAAEGALMMAIKAAPENAATLTKLASLYQQTSRLGGAVDFMRRAVTIDPNNAPNQSYLGSLLADSGHLEEAISHGEKAVHIAPKVPEYYFNLGRSQFMAKMDVAAAKNCEIAIQLNPKYARPHYIMGRIHDQAGRVADAVEQYKQAIRLEPNQAAPYWSLSIAEVQLGNDHATANYETALRLDPSLRENTHPLKAK